MEVIDYAKFGSICYHPSILPRHRGASAISWTLIEGDSVAGFSIFYADDDLDTGPVLLTRQCNVESNDTLDTLYKRFLYPEGIKAMGEAVALIESNQAPKIPQTHIGATYDPPLFKVENQIINLQQPALRIFNFIRALDSVPGATAFVETDGIELTVKLFGAVLFDGHNVEGKPIKFTNHTGKAVINEDGLFIFGTDHKIVRVQKIKKGNKMINASAFYQQTAKVEVLELTESEKHNEIILRNIWQSILKLEIENDTDFFACGAGSMDVVRLIEEVKEAFEIHLENEALFMAPTFSEFFTEVVKTSRQGSVSSDVQVEYKGCFIEANKRRIPVPTQLFIDGKFVDAENGKTLDIINPTTEQLICKVACSSKNDVDIAVTAAHKAFKGPWSQLSARQRGQLMFKLADLMEAHKEELATIESVDSGAVYTLALKTHIGMSIDAWRYFAGWTDKV